MAKLTLAKIMRAAKSGEYVGYCTKCGSKAYEVEPDARKYECEKCGAKAVYGAEELLLMMA
jgi:DNA-directed RNA polymerase subunit RPC12/RpoP